MIEHYSEVIALMGFSPIQGAILGILSLHNELEMSEIAPISGYSLSAISTNSERLAAMDVLKRTDAAR